jgi:4-amino-4-deoxy-L-arabinose transferase-like glycosyltransferase
MSRTCIALLAIFLIALGVRGAYLASELHPSTRPWVWGGMAHNIVRDGHWFQVNLHAVNFAYLKTGSGSTIEPANAPQLRYADAHPKWEPEIVEPVGEAVVLAGLWEITGSERFLPDQILRILLDSFTALLVYRIAMRLFARRRAALLAATLYALDPPLAWLVSNINQDIWAVDFTIAILAIYLEAINSSFRWRWLILCGIVVSLGSYFRPGVLILPATLALATIPMTGWREALRRGLSITAIAAVLLIPWTVRNYNDFHAFIPTRSGFGQTLWEFLGEAHNDFGAVLGDGVTYEEVHRTYPNVHFESAAYDSILMHWAIRAIEHHPLFYLELVARRTAIATVWSRGIEWMHNGTVSPFTYGRGLFSYIVNRPLDLLQMMLSPAIFVLAMFGLGSTWRRRWRAHLVLIAVVLAVIVPYILVGVVFRYTQPATFAYLIWIGLGADLLLERVSRRLRRAPYAIRTGRPIQSR